MSPTDPRPLPAPGGAAGAGRPDPIAAAVAALPLHARRSIHTRRAYFRDLSDYLGWLAARDLDPLQLTRPDVDSYLAALRTRVPAPSAATINRRLSTLSSWYGYLVDADVTTRNPVTAVDRMPVDRDHSPTVGLTVAEVRALLRAADAEHHDCARRNQALLGVLTDLGLRVSEGHRPGPRRPAAQRHRTVVIRGKGGRSRELPIPARLGRRLDAYLAERQSSADHRATERALARGLPRAALYDRGEKLYVRGMVTGPLFVTRYGNRLTQAGVFALVRRLARTAGLPAADRVSPHSLRHSAAAAALDDGAALRDVQDFLGHADPRTTRRYDRNRGSLDRSPAHRLAVLYAD